MPAPTASRSRVPALALVLVGLLAGCLGTAEPAGPGPACPEDLRVVDRDPSQIRLAWNASADAQSYNVYRGGDEMTRIATVNETTFTDTTVRGDATYAYEVTAVNETGEAEDCETVEAAAIPVFPSPAALGLALVGGLAVFGGLRARD